MAPTSPPSLKPQASASVVVGPDAASDERLMARYATGDSEALAQIFDRYAPLLLSVLQRRSTDRADAHDLVQQTFLQLHRARADFDPSRQFRPWLFSIALNVQREHFRSRSRRSEGEWLDEPSDDGPCAAARAEAAWDLERALPRLSPEQREVVELHWLADLTFPEVAAVVGATVSATRVRAHRAYARLRALLNDGDVEPSSVTLGNRGPY